MLKRPTPDIPTAVTESGSAMTSEVDAAPATSWTKPALVAFGDIRQLTMGVTPGVLESGGSTSRHD